MGDEGLVEQLTDAIRDAIGDPGRWPDVYALLKAAGAPAHQEPAEIAERLSTRFKLTQTEEEILIHIIEGTPPREIAALEGVSIATVRTHIAHLHGKFGVGRTLDVLRLALAEATHGR